MIADVLIVAFGVLVGLGADAYLSHKERRHEAELAGLRSAMLALIHRLEGHRDLLERKVLQEIDAHNATAQKLQRAMRRTKSAPRKARR